MLNIKAQYSLSRIVNENFIFLIIKLIVYRMKGNNVMIGTDKYAIKTIRGTYIIISNLEADPGLSKALNNKFIRTSI